MLILPSSPWLTHSISDIRSWMNSDNLMLNDDRTEFLILGTRQQLAKFNINCIRVGSTDVCPVTVAINLHVGSWFDEQLTTVYVNSYYGVAFYHLHNIKRIRRYCICLENQRQECLSVQWLHLVLIIATVFCMGCPNTSLTICRDFERPNMRLGFATSQPLCVVCIGYLLKPGYNLRYCLLRLKQFTALPLNIYAIY